jgi:Cu+-exporting ATPase
MHTPDLAHDTSALVTDPVCGMRVDPAAASRVVYDGLAYWFCDPACESMFRDDPVRWSASEPVAHNHAVGSGGHDA